MDKKYLSRKNIILLIAVLTILISYQITAYSYEVEVRRAFLDEQDNIIANSSYCSIDSSLMSRLGLEVGQQVEIGVGDKSALYTIVQARDEEGDVVRMGLSGRRRVGQSDPFSGYLTKVEEVKVEKALYSLGLHEIADNSNYAAIDSNLMENLGLEIGQEIIVRAGNEKDKSARYTIVQTLDEGENTIRLGLSGRQRLNRSEPFNGHIVIPTDPELLDEHIILRVVSVSKDWMRFEQTGGWDRAVPVKKGENHKYYEVAIWEDTESVRLYDFGTDYDQQFRRQSPTPTEEEAMAHREEYRVMKFTDLPPRENRDERSERLLEAFKAFADEISARHPNAHHHLVYSGHGAPGGHLFQRQLQHDDAAKFLSHWTEALGRRLGVIDMGGPCRKGGWSDLKNFCQYADYYIASDLNVGGYQMDNWSSEKFGEIDPNHQMHRFFSDPDITFEEALIKRVDLVRERYEYSRQNMIDNSVMQATHLYSCQRVRELQPVLDEFLASRRSIPSGGDLYQVLKDEGASETLKSQMLDLIIHSVDNRDFFEWSKEHRGIIDR